MLIAKTAFAMERQMLGQRILIYFTRGSVTVKLVFRLTRLDSTFYKPNEGLRGGMIFYSVEFVTFYEISVVVELNCLPYV